MNEQTPFPLGRVGDGNYSPLWGVRGDFYFAILTARVSLITVTRT